MPQYPLRSIAHGLAANASTYLLDTPLAAIIGCMSCGGIKQVVQRVGSDWTMQHVQINEDYYRTVLFPCVCHVDEVRARSLLQEIEALRETNFQLTQEKLEQSRRLEQLFSVDTQEALDGRPA